MSFTYRRLPLHCAVTYNAGLFLNPPLTYFSWLWIVIG